MSTANAARTGSKVVPLRSAESGATRRFEVTCSSCNLRELCLPQGLAPEDMPRIESIVSYEGRFGFMASVVGPSIEEGAQ